VSPRRKLSDDAMWRSEILHEFWSPNPTNLSAAVLRPKAPNLAGVTYQLRFLHNVDMCHRSSSTVQSLGPCAPAWLGQSSSWLDQHHLHCLHRYTCLPTSPRASHPWFVLQPLVPHPKPPRLSFTAPNPLAWTHLTSPLSSTVSALSTPAHHKTRDMLHNTNSHNG
jgi:hypothetical protein